MKPLSAIAAPILARLAQQRGSVLDQAERELRAVADRNAEVSRKIAVDLEARKEKA